MGKAPAFQYYVRDWLSDPQLQMASHSSKGVWADMLCYMWEAPERGKLTGTKEQLARMVSATNGDFEKFINEAKRLKFADVTICNNEITICNRRMRREQKDRENTRLRVQRHREKMVSNGKVTPPSSPSSSTSKKKDNDSPDVPKSTQDPHPSKRLILNYETGKMEGILPKDINYLKEHFPACDIDLELKEFVAYWYGQGPKKKKKNWWTALTNRLSYIQQKGGTKHGSGADSRTYDPVEKRIRESEKQLRGD